MKPFMSRKKKAHGSEPSAHIPHRDSQREDPVALKTNAKRWIAWSILIAGLLLTSVAAVFEKTVEEASAVKDFNFACNEITNRISTRLHEHAQLLRSASALFEVTGTVSREQWRSSIARQNIEQTLPGIQGIGYALYIPPDRLARHEEAIRTEGFPNYAVRPSGKRDAYSSVIWLEPFSGRNLRAFGYDMFTEPIRRKAMEDARDRDEATLSGKVHLVQESDEDVQSGTLMYVPVYGKGMPVATVAARRAALRGWVYSPYRMNDLMRGILGGWELDEGRQIRLEVFDDASLLPDALLYDSSPRQLHDLHLALPSGELSTIVFHKHSWVLRFTPAGGITSSVDYSKVWYVVIGGATVSWLLFALFLLLVNSWYRSDAKAAALAGDLLRESEQREYLETFRTVLYSIRDGVITTDLHGRVKLMNHAASELTGWLEAEAKGKHLEEVYTVINAGTRKSIENPVEKVLKTGAIAGLSNHTLLLSKEGMDIPIADSGAPLRDKDGALEGSVLVFHDKSDEYAAEILLRKSEELFRAVAQSANDAIVTIDSSGRILGWNRGAEKIFGYTQEEMIGNELTTLIPSRFVEQHRNGMKRVADLEDNHTFGKTVELYGLHKNGNEIPIELSLAGWEAASEKFFTGIIRDTTERKQSEQLLRDSQRRESIGVLSSSIAHDFNNLLGAMMGNASIAQSLLHAGHPAARSMEKVMKAVDRAAELTKQLLAYSGKGVFQICPIDIGAMVREHVSLFEVTLPKNVKLMMDLPSMPVHVDGDPGQIEQIVMNLIINGGDAIGEKQGIVSVTLTAVSLVRAELDHYSTLIGTSLSDGNYALLEVSDNGMGMSRETMNRIFDPFFTTKFTGRGLGLAAVLGIIRGHQGGITVTSKENEGTTFRVILPCGTTSEASVELHLAPVSPPPARVTTTILVIEDEQAIAELAKDILEAGNHTVTIALNPILGVELYRQHRLTIGLVLLDLTMPEMSGKEVMEALRAIDPQVKIILTSGYSAEVAIQTLGALHVSAFIQKPYRMETLLSMVRGALQ